MNITKNLSEPNQLRRMKDQTIKLPSSAKSICKLEEFIKCVADKYSIQPAKYPDILISLTEAVNNAIIHGNKENRDKYVHVVMKKTNAGLSFTVHDEGSGFNPNNLPDPTGPQHLDCCGGRGVFLMRQLADDVRYLNDGRSVCMDFSI